MILFLFEVIKTKPSGRTEFLGAFLVDRVNVFHARMIRLSMYFVGSRNGEGDRDCGLMSNGSQLTAQTKLITRDR
jgi:hypothetical protein